MFPILPGSSSGRKLTSLATIGRELEPDRTDEIQNISHFLTNICALQFVSFSSFYIKSCYDRFV